VLIDPPIFWVIAPDKARERTTAWVSKSGGELWTHHHGPWIRFPSQTPQEAAERMQRLVGSDVAIEVLTHTLPKFAALIANPADHSEKAIEKCINRSERVDFTTYRRIILRTLS
jgi:hypothetical protein